MPAKPASNPANCGGKSSAAKARISNHAATPIADYSSAPWVVARRQYKPISSGTKAPTSVTV